MKNMLDNLRYSMDRHWFLILLIVGSALSIAIRVPDSESKIGSVWAIFACVTCMVVYGAIARYDPSRLHNPDNLYYMGFIFTLVSLVYSLITLFFLDSRDLEVVRVYNLIGSFGIALISTVVGIIGRILLLQEFDWLTRRHLRETIKTAKTTESKGHGRTVPSVQGEATPHAQGGTASHAQNELEGSFQLSHDRLTETAFKLRMELTQTLADMSTFRKAIIQAVNETVAEGKRASEDIIEQTTAEMSNFRKAITLAINETAAAGKLASEDIIKQAKQSVDATQRSTSALEHDLGESSKKIKVSGDDMATALTSIQGLLQQIIDNMQSAASNSKSLTSEYQTLNASIQQSMTFFTATEKQMEQNAKVLVDATKAFSKSLNHATGVTPKYAEELQQLTATLRKETELWQSMTREVRVSLLDALKELTEVVKKS